ncbi:MAG: glutamine-hydrolyzing carbamoyl-phosphate synthase small subunit [Acidimicrobiales bacterium]
MNEPALLVLADGTELEGEAVGYWGGAPATGEVVFNTAMTGYQEILTDPSYAGQVVCFTYPHIGNYGVTEEDVESHAPAASGVIVREITRRPSNWRAQGSLSDFLVGRRIPGIAGVDTRRLTRHLRAEGALPAAFGPVSLGEDAIRAAAATAVGTDGRDLVGDVTTPEPYRCGDGPRRVVAYDFGIKATLLRHLGRVATVEVVPATTPAADVMARRPDGVFLSNGPGDPAALGWAVATVRNLVGEVPVFGICLGHQLLGAALGGRTFKLGFGHHGGNHPVKRVATGQIEITSQNHNYAVADVEGASVTHVNLNDGVVEGIATPALRAFGVQYHPEAGPGPHDAGYLFDEFRRLMERG